MTKWFWIIPALIWISLMTLLNQIMDETRKLSQGILIFFFAKE